MDLISGFSKLNKDQKRSWLLNQIGKKDYHFFDVENQQSIFDEISENTISNFILPLGIVPNVIINGERFCVPMVTEESSVVAAASKSCKFWMSRGGFKSKIISKNKVGSIYFESTLNPSFVLETFNSTSASINSHLSYLAKNMIKRGGGLKSTKIENLDEVDQTFKVEFCFDTCDAMGANFINSYLESYAKELKEVFSSKIEVIMCILSNYTPECRVKVSVSAPIEVLGNVDGYSAEDFSHKFKRAVDIAFHDRDRAVTHNKGIMNGVDSVVLATGNDFRAIEACVHSYASRDGQYRSLSSCSIDNDIFEFSMELPLSIGTVGGLTKIHPMAKFSLEILNNPNSDQLMKIIASIGLAQNFAAIRSLVTTGIQKGHMKMHLLNILKNFDANEVEKIASVEYFKDKVVSYHAVQQFIELNRIKH